MIFFFIFVIFFPIGTFLVISYILFSWNKETPLVKSNFLSSQMVSHSFSPSSLPIHKAKWVQQNGKILQVLKNSLCSGDSGGPLIIPKSDTDDTAVLIGIVSFGYRCGLSDAPGVYTRVTEYISWIQSTRKGKHLFSCTCILEIKTFVLGSRTWDVSS